VLTLALIAADTDPLATDKALQKADERYTAAVAKAQEDFNVLKAKENEKRLKAYKTALESATRAGNFDKATALKARIAEYEQETETPLTGTRNLHVLSAMYGVNQSWLDVTDKLAKKIGGKPEWSVVVTNDDWGDPAPGFAGGNTLVVRYSTNGKITLKAGYEGRELTLP
jgi:hypothetical protein